MNPTLSLNPNGIPSLGPGLRAGRYPGSTSQTRPNPERVDDSRGGARLRRAVTADDGGASGASISARWKDAHCVRLAALVRRLDGVSPHRTLRRVDASAYKNSRDAATDSPSPLNGERAGVRGGKAERVRHCESHGQYHPSPSFPLPVEGRGRPDRRDALVRRPDRSHPAMLPLTLRLL